MRPLKVGGNCAYRSIRIVLNVVINRFSVFISYRPCGGWQLFDLFCQSFALVCMQTQNNKKTATYIILSAYGEDFECYSHARNKCFQLPVIPTANQVLWHCSKSQSALRPKSKHRNHKLVRLYQVQF